MLLSCLLSETIQALFLPPSPHWPGFQKHLSVLKSWYKREKVIAADPGIAGRCLCANVGQMSSGIRQQTLGTECTKVQTCYFGDCSKWGQAGGAKLMAANNRAAKGTGRFSAPGSLLERCSQITDRAKMSSSGSIPDICKVWEVPLLQYSSLLRRSYHQIRQKHGEAALPVFAGICLGPWGRVRCFWE